MDNSNSRFFLIAVIVWNVITFALYGLDKLFSKAKMRRISEKTLLGSSLALGGVGAFFGMRVFRHKTKHQNFNLTVPVGAVITILAVFLTK